MRKKIILGIVIFAILAAVGGAVYFNNNYAVVYGHAERRRILRTDVKRITFTTDERTADDEVLCTPSLKKFTELERLQIKAYENTNFEYLSEMNNLETLYIWYYDGYCKKLESLPKLPNLKELILIGQESDDKNIFELSNENEYNFSNIESLEILSFDDVDLNSLKHFNNLKNLYIHSHRTAPDMDSISVLQYLENIELYTSLKESELIDFSGLKNNKNLKKLNIFNDCEGIFDGCEGIFDGCKDDFFLENTDCFSELESVEELKLTNIHMKNIDGLLKMRSLKKITVDNTHSTINIYVTCITEEQAEELQRNGIEVEINSNWKGRLSNE